MNKTCFILLACSPAKPGAHKVSKRVHGIGFNVQRFFLIPFMQALPLIILRLPFYLSQLTKTRGQVEGEKEVGYSHRIYIL